jgi:hypothetical protein
MTRRKRTNIYKSGGKNSFPPAEFYLREYATNTVQIAKQSDLSLRLRTKSYIPYDSWENSIFTWHRVIYSYKYEP